jgi:hypothetical protein
MKLVRIYLVLFSLTLVAACVIYTSIPAYRDYLLLEDSLIENLSALFFLLTVVIGLLFALKSEKHRKLFILVSVVGLLAFLEEISFGERIFAIDMPYLGDVKIDSLHDFFFLFDPSDFHAPYFFLLAGCGAIVAGIAAVKYRRKLKEIIVCIYQNPPFILALIFASIVLVTLVIDLDMVEHEFLFMVEEILEMNAAIALLFCCLSLYHLDKGTSRT